MLQPRNAASRPSRLTRVAWIETQRHREQPETFQGRDSHESRGLKQHDPLQEQEFEEVATHTSRVD